MDNPNSQPSKPIRTKGGRHFEWLNSSPRNGLIPLPVSSDSRSDLNGFHGPSQEGCYFQKNLSWLRNCRQCVCVARNDVGALKKHICIIL